MIDIGNRITNSQSSIFFQQIRSRNMYLSGGCSDWNMFLFTTLSNALLRGSFDSVSIVNENIMFGNTSRVTCQSPLIASNLSVSLMHGTAVELVCESNSWNVAVCSGSIAMCVNCSNPCIADICSDIFALSPCSSLGDCPESSKSGEINILQFDYRSHDPAPALLNVSMIAGRNNLSIEANLSSYGFLTCMILPFGTVPISTFQLQISGKVSEYSISHSLFFDNLIPFTHYSLFCMTESKSGDPQSYSVMLRSRNDFRTLCCKTIFLRLIASSVIQSKEYVNAVEVSVDSPPVSNLTLVVYSTNEERGYSAPLVPNIVFSPTLPTSMFCSLLKNSTRMPGNLTLSVNVVSDVYSEYYLQPLFVYDNTVIEVIETSSPLPAPYVQSVQFDSSYSFIVVIFNSDTDRGGLNFKSFSCSVLIQFSTASNSLCQWMDGKTLKMWSYILSNFLVPGDQIQVVGSKIRGVCDGCSSRFFNKAQRVTVMSSAIPLYPVPILQAPQVISVHSSLQFDISTSSGLAGRNFSSTFSVVGTGCNSSCSLLRDYLNSHVQLSPPIPIASKVYSNFTGAVTISLTLCNFLSYCGITSLSIYFVTDEIPSVSILGSSKISVLAKDGVSLTGRITSNSRSDNAFISYSWSISVDGFVNPSLKSYSMDPLSFKLSPFSLAPSTTYVVTLSALNTRSQKSSSATVTVVVGSGDIVSILSVGDQVSAKPGTYINIDASSSYDQDYANTKQNSRLLGYSWSCSQYSPSFLLFCPQTTQTLSPINSNLRIFVKESSIVGSQFNVSVRVYSLSNPLKYSVSSTIVTVAPVSCPTIRITPIYSKLNPVYKVKVFAEITSSFSAVCDWKILDSSISNLLLSNSTLFVSTAGIFRFDLLFKANALAAGMSYSLTLTCVSALSAVSFSTISITTNAPPQYGAFDVSPSSGLELSTSFQLAASKWVDEDLPITYSLGYLSEAGIFQYLCKRTQFSSVSSLLPSGSSTKEFELLCGVLVFDSLLANNSMYRTVVVNKTSENIANTHLLNAMTSHSTGSLTMDESMQLISLGSSFLNAISCNTNISCSLLSRLNCTDTTDVCGPCFSGFVGESGSKNSACFSASYYNQPVPSSCHSNYECGPWRLCMNSTCVDTQKGCDLNCSGHGSCDYYNILDGSSTSSCWVGDGTCKQICACDVGYDGASCSHSSLDFSNRTTFRDFLTEVVLNVTQLEDPDEISIIGWSSSVSAMSFKSDELSSVSSSRILQISNNILTSASKLGLSYDSFSGTFDAIDSSFSVLQPFTKKRRLLSNDDFINQNNLLRLIGNISQSSMVIGMSPITFVKSSFRMITYGWDTSSKFINCVSPILDSEKSYFKPDELNLALLENISYNSTLFVTYALSTQLFSSYINKPAVIVMSNAAICGNNNCNFTLRTSYSKSMSFLNSTHYPTFKLYCRKNQPRNVTYDCGNNFNLTLSCDGLTFHYQVGTCPYGRTIPSCTVLASNLDGSTSTCSLASYDHTSAVCRCQFTSTDLYPLSTAWEYRYSTSRTTELSLVEDSWIVPAVVTREKYHYPPSFLDNVATFYVTNKYSLSFSIALFIACSIIAYIWYERNHYKFKNSMRHLTQLGVDWKYRKNEYDEQIMEVDDYAEVFKSKLSSALAENSALRMSLGIVQSESRNLSVQKINDYEYLTISDIARLESQLSLLWNENKQLKKLLSTKTPKGKYFLEKVCLGDIADYDQNPLSIHVKAYSSSHEKKRNWRKRDYAKSIDSDQSSISKNFEN